jgi:hypothetical protein
MADVTGEPNPAAEPGSPVQDEPQSFVGEDGTFKEGWIDAYVPEDLRHLGDFRPIATVAQLAKEFGHAKTLIGRQGKGIMPLSKDAGPTEKEAYYNALGRPKAPDDYKFDVPKDLEEIYHPSEVEDVMATMHGLGLTQEQAAGMMGWDFQRMQKAIADREGAQKTAYDTALKVLQTEWGDAFPQKMKLANRVIAENVENVPADKREELSERWGNDLELIRVLSAIGETMLEDKMADGGGAGQGVLTPDDLERKARELVATPGYLEGRLPEATRERLRKEIRALHEKSRIARGGG